MTFLELLTVAMMVAFVPYGIYLAADWELERRIVGISTLLGDGLAMYLFCCHWLFVNENNPYGLAVIALLVPCGYLAGLAIASLIRIDWFEDLLEIKPLELSRPRSQGFQGHG